MFAFLAPLLLLLPREAYAIRAVDDVEVDGEVDGELEGEVDVTDMNDAFDQLTGDEKEAEDMLRKYDQQASKKSCTDWQMEMHKLLDAVNDDIMEMSTMSDAPCRDEYCTEFADLPSSFQDSSQKVLSITELANRGNCLPTLFSAEIKGKMAKVVDGMDKFRAKDEAVDAAHGRLVKWQHAILAVGPAPAFDPSTSFNAKDHCPDECRWCSFRHKSLFKRKETLQFKCGLRRGRPAPQQDKGGNGLTCTQPKRRWTAFWQRKTWCRVEDTDLVKQRSRAAQISCSMLFLRTSVKVEAGKEAGILSVCHKFEQGVVLSIDESRTWANRFTNQAKWANDYVVSRLNAMEFVINLGVSVGIAAVAEGSEGEKLFDVFTKGKPTEGGEWMFDMPDSTGLVTCGDALTTPSFVGSAMGMAFRITFGSLVAAGTMAFVVLFSPFLWAISLGYFFGASAEKRTAANFLLLFTLPLRAPFFVASGFGQILGIGWKPYDCPPAQIPAALGGICVKGMYLNQAGIRYRNPEPGNGASHVEVSCGESGSLTYRR